LIFPAILKGEIMGLDAVLSKPVWVTQNQFCDEISRKYVNTIVIYEHHYSDNQDLPNREFLLRIAAKKAKEQNRKLSFLTENLPYCVTELARQYSEKLGNPEKQKEALYKESLDSLNIFRGGEKRRVGEKFVWPLVQIALQHGEIIGINLPDQQDVNIVKDNFVNNLLEIIPEDNLRVVSFGYGHFPFLRNKDFRTVEVVQTGRKIEKANGKFFIDKSQNPQIISEGILKLNKNTYQLNQLLQ
jgi:hypothetical protein